MKRLFSTIAFLLAAFLCTAQTLTSSNLPIIVINTGGQEIPDDPKITASMGIVYNGEGVRNNITDPFNHYNGKIGIEIRGQSTQQFPMKAYTIELRKADGSSTNKSLFGLPQESDWVLYAPYNEKTLMHNFLAYTISRQMGHWAANCRYVELILNGEYRGIYVFMEKIKRKTGRVEISSIASTDVAGDAVTGGYIFSIDKQADGWFSSYNAGLSKVQFSYVYPKVDKITTEQQAYIKSYVDSFETSLHVKNFQDKNNGWRAFADESSFIDYLLVNEVSRNIDGYRLSSYFYKDRNSVNRKIIAGPVWDYDLAFKNANYCDGSLVSGWSYNFNYVCPSDYFQVPDWWSIMLRDTAFQSNMYCRWKAMRNTVLKMDNLNKLIDSVVTLTAEARQRHFAKWPVLGVYVWPNSNPIAATYEEEITQLKTWLEARMNWIDANIAKTGGCVDYPITATTSFIVRTTENPATSTERIVIQSKKYQKLTVLVSDASGRVMGEYFMDLVQGTGSYTIPSAAWAKGMYVLRFMNADGEKTTRKVLKF